MFFPTSTAEGRGRGEVEGRGRAVEPEAVPIRDLAQQGQRVDADHRQETTEGVDSLRVARDHREPHHQPEREAHHEHHAEPRRARQRPQFFFHDPRQRIAPHRAGQAVEPFDDAAEARSGARPRVACAAIAS